MIRIAATSRRPSGGLIVGCLYLPNGNPAPGPKFDYKLRLFERLTGYSKSFGQRRAGSDLARNRKFESSPLQRRVCCEPLDQVPLAALAIALLASFAHSGARTRQCRGAHPGSDDGHPLPQRYDQRRQYFLSRSGARRWTRLPAAARISDLIAHGVSRRQHTVFDGYHHFPSC
jgi:hypothetical protein